MKLRKGLIICLYVQNIVNGCKYNIKHSVVSYNSLLCIYAQAWEGEYSTYNIFSQCIKNT